MLVRAGKLDLNSVQAYTGSLKDMLKKTMLRQEVLFKEQVHELHHLYRIQRTLMENLGGKEVGRYNFIKASAESTLSPFRNSTRDEPLDLVEGCDGVYDKIQPRTPDLRLQSDQRVSHMDHEELKLSLSIQEANMREGGSKRTWFDVETNSCSQNVIDLEESIERTSVQSLEISPSFGSVTPTKNFGGKHDSSSGKRSVVFRSVDGNALLDYSEWNPFNQGLQKGSGGILANNSSTRRQEVSSCEAGLLDLNKIQHDDSSCLSNDPTVAHPSTASSSRAVHGLVGMVEEGTVCFETGNSNAASSQGNYMKDKVEDPKFSYSNHSQNTKQDGHGKISSASSMPDCIGDYDSSTKKIQQSEAKFGNTKAYSFDKFSGTHVGSPVSETLMGEQQGSSDSRELKHKYLNKEVDSAELDLLITEAAEALVGISLGSSSCDQDDASKVGRSNKMETKESEQPRASDFFELMTLMLTESSADEYSVSSKPSGAIYTDSADFGFKLRRGRRLKDFQKDILPGLATLSRHEICEDVSIMETALRSREYKKLRGKMADGHSWCTPVRNKRSRLNNVPRRRKAS